VRRFVDLKKLQCSTWNIGRESVRPAEENEATKHGAGAGRGKTKPNMEAAMFHVEHHQDMGKATADERRSRNGLV
jgi:hypothetical protein